MHRLRVMLNQRKVLLLHIGAHRQGLWISCGGLLELMLGVPHPNCRRRGTAMSPVKVGKGNIKSNNSSSSDKRDERGQKFALAK